MTDSIYVERGIKHGIRLIRRQFRSGDGLESRPLHFPATIPKLSVFEFAFATQVILRERFGIRLELRRLDGFARSRSQESAVLSPL